MKFHHLFLSVYLVAAGCSSVPVDSASATSPYNQGVAAYKAKNYAKARVEWGRAVADGEATAQNNLAYLMFNGLGGDPDRTRAVILWQKAARDGVSESQWHLGALYENGDGVDRNYVEAFAWYKCSIARAESARGEGSDTERAIASDSRKSLVDLLGKLST